MILPDHHHPPPLRLTAPQPPSLLTSVLLVHVSGNVALSYIRDFEVLALSRARVGANGLLPQLTHISPTSSAPSARLAARSFLTLFGETLVSLSLF
jgi:hypothetical protein